MAGYRFSSRWGYWRRIASMEVDNTWLVLSFGGSSYSGPLESRANVFCAATERTITIAGHNWLWLDPLHRYMNLPS